MGAEPLRQAKIQLRRPRSRCSNLFVEDFAGLAKQLADEPARRPADHVGFADLIELVGADVVEFSRLGDAARPAMAPIAVQDDTMWRGEKLLS